MDLSILFTVQNWHAPALDRIMVFLFHTVIDEKGVFAVLLGLLLLALKKTRRYGGLMLLSILFSFLIGDLLLKNAIARPRPFITFPDVTLITEAPNGYSCPSVHTAIAFSCAMTVFLKNKKAGVPCLLFAALIGFSRLYFFVHYPTDVLFGAALGVLCAIIAADISLAVAGRRFARQNK